MTLCIDQPGKLLARGVVRHLVSLDMACVTEFAPIRGLRVDVLALSRNGTISVIECKSSRADFMSDSKWQGYLDWGDRFYWAVDAAFPTDLLPAETGLILADPYGAEIIREGQESRLAPARRKAMTLRIARIAARRLSTAIDPGLIN